MRILVDLFRALKFVFLVTPLLPKHKKTNGETLVFCWLVSMRSTMLVDLLFMVAASRRGAKPVVVLYKRRPLSYLFLTFFKSFDKYYLEDYKNKVGEVKLIDKFEALIENDKSLKNLLHYSRDGVNHGRNVMSTVLRKLRCSEIDVKNTIHRKTLLDCLVESHRARSACESLLRDLSPSHAVIVEKGYTPAAEFYDLCIEHEIDVVQWLGAPKSDSILLKRYNRNNQREHPLSLGDDTWKKVLQGDIGAKEKDVLASIEGNYLDGSWFNRQQLNEGKNLYSASETLAKIGIRPGRKVAVIFCHIFYDATFFYGQSLFSNYKTWLVETVREAINNDALDWVVKVHPVNVWRSKMDAAPLERLEDAALYNEFTELPDHIKILYPDTEINTLSLFNAIDYGVTVRGTVGIELPCYGIPAITAGSGRYSGRGFTIDHKTVEEYRNTLRGIQNIQKLDQRVVSLARRYAFVAFNLRPLEIRSFQIPYNTKSSAIAINSDILLSQLDHGDISKVVSFILDSKEEDYLNNLSLIS